MVSSEKLFCGKFPPGGAAMSLNLSPEAVKRLLNEQAAELLPDIAEEVAGAAHRVLRQNGAVRLFGCLRFEKGSLVACTAKGRFPIPFAVCP